MIERIRRVPANDSRTAAGGVWSVLRAWCVGWLGAWLAVGALAATNDAPAPSPPTPPTDARPNDPAEAEYQKLLREDDRALEEVDRWIRENQAFAEQGAGVSQAALSLRIEQRLQPVRESYEDFLRRHPTHARAWLAYGSFLDDVGEDAEAKDKWEKARELDPSNPAAWNNLANYYGHRGPVKKAFEYYAKAIELNPREPTYYQNLATTTYLFRKDAMEYYQIDEQAVFDRALDLYRQALRLDPTNFELAADYAQTYYGIRPLRTELALAAWEAALKIAPGQDEREGVHLHLARVNLAAGRFDQAHAHLAQVSLPKYQTLKARLARNLAEKERQSENAPVATESTPSEPAKPETKPNVSNLEGDPKP
jgi:tetratricopeptide (TPR) repeat protein